MGRIICMGFLKRSSIGLFTVQYSEIYFILQINCSSQVLRNKFIVPYVYLGLMIISFVTGLNWPNIKQILAIYPRDFHYLIGVFTTVFVHKDLEHLSSNSLPMFVCLFGLFYFYKEIAFKVTVICHLLTGMLIWIFAREAFHIGASGLVYALVLFVFTSGLIRKNKKLLVFAFITLVFQSGLLWGVFPVEEGISWESHLLGALVGIFLSFLFKNEGPQADLPKIWDEETEETITDEYLNL